MTNCKIKGVTTRGGKTTTHDVQTNNTNVHTEEPLVVNHDKPVESNEVLDKDQPQTTNEPLIQTSSEEQTSSIHFPRRLRKEKEEAKQRKFLENVKQLHINLPFIEALAQMPKYTKFLKGLLTNKSRFKKACTITVNERCSTVLLNKLPSKEKDPESFTIPCDIGLGEPKPTRMSSELADRSTRYPGGIIENVLIKVNKFILPIDFVILDMPEDSRIPIRRINSVNTPYSVKQRTTRLDGVKREHLYSASANEIDEKRPELKRFFQISIAPEDQEKTTFTCHYGTFAYRRMPFGLCNAPATFQRCMTTIFHDMVEDFTEVFMDDFSVFGNSFDCCLANLDRMLTRCEETNLVINWEKCDFMEKEGIILGHKISRAGIEVDRAKIDVIAKLPYPTNVKGVRSILGHAGFYQRVIKDFSMISKPMTKLLMKDVKFDFYDDCKKAFNILKERLTTTPIIISHDWNVPFELMCDATDFAVGAVLGQRIYGKFKPIYYSSKTLNNAQEHYTTIEKELLAVVFSFDKFCSYLILSKAIVYTDHSALKYLFSKQDAKPRLIRWVLLLQGFDIEVELNDDEPWYVDYINYIVQKIVPLKWTPEKRRRFFSQVKNYFWYEPYVFILCPDNVMRRCVAGSEILKILARCHFRPTGGHYCASITGRKVYESRFFWPSIFKDVKDYVMRCDACQRSGNISSRSEIPQNNIQVGDKVLLGNSRFKMHPGKLKSKWYGPNVVKAVYQYEMVEITEKNEISFKVNGQRLKKYYDGNIIADEREVVKFKENTT
ncbi:putative nucleotidyltransferase, ribonuclease H [Tanacetum coccineum]